jgi:hypothetical protein
VNWIHVAEDRDRWRALVNSKMNLQVSHLSCCYLLKKELVVLPKILVFSSTHSSFLFLKFWYCPHQFVPRCKQWVAYTAVRAWCAGPPNMNIALGRGQSVGLMRWTARVDGIDTKPPDLDQQADLANLFRLVRRPSGCDGVQVRYISQPLRRDVDPLMLSVLPLHPLQTAEVSYHWTGELSCPFFFKVLSQHLHGGTE